MAVANKACVAVALVAATATVPVTLGKVAVLSFVAALCARMVFSEPLNSLIVRVET